jgi:hypothetical protein
MKEQTVWGSRSRRQERLYSQRRYQAVQQWEQTVRDDEEKQRRERRSGQTRVSGWWKPDVGEDAIRLGSMSWRFNCVPLVLQPLPGTSQDHPGGYPSLNTTNPSTPVRSWKTLELRKACNKGRGSEQQERWTEGSGTPAAAAGCAGGAVADEWAAGEQATAQQGKISAKDRPRETHGEPHGWRGPEAASMPRGSV